MNFFVALNTYPEIYNNQLFVISNWLSEIVLLILDILRKIKTARFLNKEISKYNFEDNLRIDMNLLKLTQTVSYNFKLNHKYILFFC